MTRRSAKASNKEVSSARHSTQTKHEHERQHEHVRSSSTEVSKFELLDQTQRLANRSCKHNDLTILSGPAGSGKSLIAIYSAYQLYKSHESPVDKIIIVRLAAETMGESIGALPGSKDEKLMYLAAPIVDNFEQFCSSGEIQYMLENNRVEVIPISHTRGRSFRNCVVIVEEIQNLSSDMVLTVLTRLGENSRMVVTGDPRQCDFYDRNGMQYCIKLTEGLEGVGVFQFSALDIKRHPLVKAIVMRQEEMQKEKRREREEERHEPKLR